MKPLICLYPPPLTRQELDVAKCAQCGGADPACRHEPELIFNGRCHLEAPTISSYNKHDGIVTIKCSVCQKLVARIKVAFGHLEGLN
ncbi:MAG: hypothetical protein E6R03_16455 [Hyphomicrobiaceae bacterium]|nr:MAG: hypothetical protein E6R03_16455 [Hyphomicrobiaceae bacterium]